MDEEFDNFMAKVTEVEDLVQKLGCSNADVVENALRRADLFLRNDQGLPARASGQNGELDIRCRANRTLINQKAIDSLGRPEDPAEMSKEAFMAQVERDAAERARDKRERKQRSDRFRAEANQAFREKRFEKALYLYDKAICETNDNFVLYENRALTCLHLELNGRAVADCDWALRLNDSSLKALLYKAKAFHRSGENQRSESCIQEASRKHPHQLRVINDYKVTWQDEGKR